ncbi:uncharacterized protein LOC133909770 [Phragmites australis]|uniref:uncharacterized protein LOC133909770 n=1 Tax=Phragmites australis TaxID=29695 RepID=UPI002D79672E|nr:uncharacterized protein LOC133909770 [Phragmites australis]
MSYGCMDVALGFPPLSSPACKLSYKPLAACIGRSKVSRQQAAAMARPLLQHKTDRTTTSHSGAPAPHLLFLLLLAAAAVATVVVSLCTSSKHSKPWKQRVGSSAPAPQVDGGSARKQLLASLSGIGGKAAAVAKMVSWNRRSPPAGGWSSASDDDDAEAAGGAVAEGEALWKKTIIMGDKCRPLEFSGSIAYDSDGNRLQPPPAAEIKKGATDAAVK